MISRTKAGRVYKIASGALLLLLLPLFSICSAFQAVAGQSSQQQHEEILVVDIAYDLLISLSEYSELIEEENRGVASANERLIPVIDQIINGFKGELETYLAMVAIAGLTSDDARSAKIRQHIESFETELRVRRKALEFDQLRLRQRQLIEKME